MSRRLGVVTSVVLFAAAAGLLFWRSDVHALETAARNLPLATVGTVFVLLLAGGLLAGWRLQLISSEFAIALSARDAIVLFAESTIVGNLIFQFFGQMLARSLWLSGRGHARSAGVLMTLYEKGVATTISVAMGVVGAWYLFGRLSLDLQSGGAELVKVALGISFVIAISGVVGWGPALAPFLLKPFETRFVAGLVKISMLSVVVQASTMLAYILACRALAPDVPQADLIAVTALVMLAASLPISFAGWGLREISAVFAMGAVGVSVEKAFLVAVLIGVTSQAALLAIVLAGLALRNRTTSSVVAPAPCSEAFAYDLALGWAVPVCAAMAVYFQVHVPLRDGLINVNLADPVAIIGAGLFLAAGFGSSEARPAWRLRFLEPHVAVATLVLAISLVHGVLVIGPTEWAVTNKFVGWFVLLAYGATGALIVTAGGRAGLLALVLTFAASGSAVALFEFGLTVLGRLGIIGLDMDQALRLNGFAQNPNAFAFQMLLAAAAVIVTARSTSAAVPMLSLCLFGLWMAGSRAVLVALPVTLLAAGLMGVRVRSLLLKSTPLAIAIIGFTGVAALMGPMLASTMAGQTHIGFIPALIESEGSKSEHWISIVQGLQLFFESPVFGCGLGVYIYEQMKQSGTLLIIHSTPIWLLAETGLVGFLAFAVPFGRVLAGEWKRRQLGDIGSQLIVTSLVAFAVTSMGHEMLYQRAIWLLLGAGLACGISKQGQGRPVASEPDRVPELSVVI